MSVIHILNIADWALMAAGLGVALLMILVGAGGEPPSTRDPGDGPERRRNPR